MMESRDQATRSHRPEHALARVYLARALDPVVELAQALADANPAVGGRAADRLAEFRELTGLHLEWPDTLRRNLSSTLAISRYYRSTGVYQGFSGLRLAALQCGDSLDGEREPAGRRALLAAITELRADIESHLRADLPTVERIHTGLLDAAVSVLTAADLFETFPITRPATDYTGYHPVLAERCETVSRAIGLSRPITRNTFCALDRAGIAGAAVIDLVLGTPLSGPDDDRLLDVVHHAAAWARALGDLLAAVDVPRAWSDPAYRALLRGLERDVLPPHPAGEIDLEGSIRMGSARPAPSVPVYGFSTETVNGEICCSTGDLFCGWNTNGDCGLSDDCETLTGVWWT